MQKFKLKKSDKILIGIFAGLLLINALSWISTAFSDFYVRHIYPIYSAVPVFLTGLLPFSIGEIMVIFCALFGVGGIISVIAFTIVKHRDSTACMSVLTKTLRLTSWILFYIFTTETLGCFVMYHCTPFSERYFEPVEHSEELLLDTLSAFSTRISELYDKFERDEQGYIILEGDSCDDCRAAMRELGGEYSQLSGYYPRAKRVLNSFFMSQEGIIGLYVPFAFEATYNRDIQPIAQPATICHELAHLKGIIQEDEASFVAIVAGLKHGGDALKYSACIDGFYYLYKNAQQLSGTEYEDRLWEAVAAVPKIVWEKDLSSYTEDYWEKNKHKEIIPTETVSAISDALTDANLTLNGVSDGINSYNRVVELLMDYHANGGVI